MFLQIEWGGVLVKVNASGIDLSNNANGGFGWAGANASYAVSEPLSVRDNADGTVDILSAYQDPSGFRHPYFAVHCNGDETFLMHVRSMRVNTYIDWNAPDVFTVGHPFALNVTKAQAQKVIVVKPTFDVANYEVKISFGARGVDDAGLFGVTMYKVKTRKLFDALGLFRRESV